MGDLLSRIKMPPRKAVTPDEIERRRRLFDEVMRLRQTMPPLGFDAAELVRQVRDELDDSNG